MFFCFCFVFCFVILRWYFKEFAQQERVTRVEGKKAHQKLNTSTSEFDFGLNGKPVVFHDLNTNEYNVLLHWTDERQTITWVWVCFSDKKNNNSTTLPMLKYEKKYRIVAKVYGSYMVREATSNSHILL